MPVSPQYLTGQRSSLNSEPAGLSTGGFTSRPFAFVCVLGCVRLFAATLWTVAPQAPLSTDPPGKNPGVGLPFPPPGDVLLLIHM